MQGVGMQWAVVPRALPVRDLQAFVRPDGSAISQPFLLIFGSNSKVPGAWKAALISLVGHYLCFQVSHTLKARQEHCESAHHGSGSVPRDRTPLYTPPSFL